MFYSDACYLVGKDADKIKSFNIKKISNLQVSDATFAADPTVEKTLEDDEGIMLNADKTTVTLKITGDAVGYFHCKNLVPNQIIAKAHEDGSLTVTTEVAYVNQILPIVRQWIPYVRILSPEGWQTEMERGLHGYLAG